MRAYATNSQGTGYGAERSFTTDSESVPGDTKHLLKSGSESKLFIYYDKLFIHRITWDGLMQMGFG